MKSQVFYKLVVIILLVPTINIVSAYPKRNMKRAEYLDPEKKFLLEWQVNWQDQRVIFNVTVAVTNVWIGLGFSTSLSYSGADIVVGGVNKSCNWLQDRHIVEKANGREAHPVLDNHRDYHLITSWENERYTSLKFSRAFDTFDKKQDYKIPFNQVTNLIWARGLDTEFVTDVHSGPSGFHQVVLLDPNYLTKSNGWGWNRGH